MPLNSSEAAQARDALRPYVDPSGTAAFNAMPDDSLLKVLCDGFARAKASEEQAIQLSRSANAGGDADTLLLSREGGSGVVAERFIRISNDIDYLPGYAPAALNELKAILAGESAKPNVLALSRTGSDSLTLADQLIAWLRKHKPDAPATGEKVELSRRDPRADQSDQPDPEKKQAKALEQLTSTPGFQFRTAASK